ncbi:IS21 family transposase [Undibacterium arcticum]
MANNRLSMRKILEVLRLFFELGRSKREIARVIGASPTTVSDYLSRIKLAGLSYPLPPEMDEQALDRLLFPPSEPSAVQRPEPDWAQVHDGLRRKGVTLDLLWQEYKSEQPEGYQYSAFCGHYRRWRQRLTLSMRQTHTPGERLFLDYAGQTVSVTDQHSGEIREAQIFVAVLGASNYTFLEATWSQQLPDWIGSHVRPMNFYGGTTELWVPDNLRSGVTKASRYEPDINPTYQDLASHYEVGVLPARARKPKDKAKVENGVLVVERWVLARLRHQRFFSINELNRVLRDLLTDLNARPFKKLPGCRASAFAEMDQPALRPLPEKAYEYAEWKLARVGIDYHVDVGGHYYSVPCQFARQQVDVRTTATTVEVFHRGTRLASHVHCTFKGRHTTIDAHMPPAHRAVAGVTAETLRSQATAIGPRTEVLIERLLHQRRHPQQAFRSCLGVLRLGQEFGTARLEAACVRALKHNAVSWKSVHSILKHGLDQQVQAADQRVLDLPEHENVRGAAYYQTSLHLH